MLAGATVAAASVAVVVELDEVAGARIVGSAGREPHATTTPASIVAITTDTRNPRMVPYLPLSRRLR